MSVDSITAIFTVIIAVISLGFSIYSACKQRKFNITLAKREEEFNRNSVKPVCNIIFDDYEDDIAVKIRNVGPGVATIKSFTCLSQETGFSFPSLIKVFDKGICIHDDNDIIEEGDWTDFMVDIIGRSIGSSGELVLLRMHDDNPEIIKAIRYTLRPLKIEITYCDVYGTIFSVKRNLDWFGRTLL